MGLEQEGKTVNFGQERGIQLPDIFIDKKTGDSTVIYGEQSKKMYWEPNSVDFQALLLFYDKPGKEIPSFQIRTVTKAYGYSVPDVIHYIQESFAEEFPNLTILQKSGHGVNTSYRLNASTPQEKKSYKVSLPGAVEVTVSDPKYEMFLRILARTGAVDAETFLLSIDTRARKDYAKKIERIVKELNENILKETDHRVEITKGKAGNLKNIKYHLVRKSDAQTAPSPEIRTLETIQPEAVIFEAKPKNLDLERRDPNVRIIIRQYIKDIAAIMPKDAEWTAAMIKTAIRKLGIEGNFSGWINESYFAKLEEEGIIKQNIFKGENPHPRFTRADYIRMRYFQENKARIGFTSKLKDNLYDIVNEELSRFEKEEIVKTNGKNGNGKH